MHKLNFCGSLCLPQKVEGESRGMNIVMNFTEGVVIPFSGAATPLHALYTSRPFIPETGQILQAADLDNPIKVSLAKSQGAVAADMVLDTDPTYSIVSAKRDENLRHIVDRLFSKGYHTVAFWSNNGLGSDSSLIKVVRDSKNVAYEVVADAKTWSNFDIAPKPSGLYSSVAHDHIQFAPDNTGFSAHVQRELDDAHRVIRHDTLEGVIARANSMPGFNQGFTYCIVNKNTNLSKPLVHSFYPVAYTYIPETERQKFIRKQTMSYSISVGLNYDDKDFVKSEIAKTAEFYKQF